MLAAVIAIAIGASLVAAAEAKAHARASEQPTSARLSDTDVSCPSGFVCTSGQRFRQLYSEPEAHPTR